MNQKPKRTRGRPKLGNKLFARRLSVEQIKKVMAALAAGSTEYPVTMTIDAIIPEKNMLQTTCEIGGSTMAQTKAQTKAMLEDIGRLEGEKESLEAQVKELQAGLTDPYIRGLRALVSKQQLEIARLS